MSNSINVTPASESEFVAYEYSTVRVPRELEGLYADSYRDFGWIVDGRQPGPTAGTASTLQLKRDRRLKNRSMIVELQRSCDTALTSIAALDRSASTTAISVAIAFGIAGSALLAGSVFLLGGGLIVLSIVLGAVGLLGWLAGYLGFGRAKTRRAAQVAPRITELYETVYETREQASRLRA